MFPGTENRNEGTCGCSPAPKTGMRAHSPKPPFYKTALLFPLEVRRDLQAIGPYEFQGKSIWTNPLVPCFEGKSVWTNGSESSSKFSPEIGIGPWMALPSACPFQKAFQPEFGAYRGLARVFDVALDLSVLQGVPPTGLQLLR